MTLMPHTPTLTLAQFAPDGRRVITGLHSGEFTLWNALTFNFEMIMLAHEKQPVRAMTYSPYDDWLVSGDDSGSIKYWLPNLANVKDLPAHPNYSIRGLSYAAHLIHCFILTFVFSFAPTSSKLVSCADDNLLKVWNFASAAEELTLKGAHF